ncbi:MAG: HAMP domain-containing protein, partial [Desulfobacterota bacterium]|nr:HAMP domain-containing protein [Thermodesulfobacteriota bacterium]
MNLNKKIILMTVSILFVSLLTNAAFNIVSFQKNYTQALLTGSFGLAHTINSVITEMLNLGLPLDSLGGMNAKCRQLIEKNPHIIYCGVVDTTGKVLYHSDPELIGRVFTDTVMKKSIAALQPLAQQYQRFDGHTYMDVSVPILDLNQQHLGAVRLGFRKSVIDEEVMSAGIQVAINFVASFLFIAFLINYGMRKFVVHPLKILSKNASRIVAGDFDVQVPVTSHDEVGALSETFNTMALAIKKSHTELEELVAKRTAALEVEIAERKKTEGRLIVLNRLYRDLLSGGSLKEKAQRITDTLNEVLGADFTRIWVIRE